MGQGSLRSLAALLALALAEAAAGCGGGGARRPPAPAQRRQEEQARAGARAWAKGDLKSAIAAQERALLAARSVEDEEGIALRVLDLAALHRAAGAAGAASAALAELLAEPPPLPYPGRLRAEAARLAGLLALDAGDAPGGARWAARALELDKRLGLEAKIFLDLVGLGRSAQGQGRAGEARGWFERARAVALAAGDEAGATEAAALLEGLPPAGR